MKHFCLAIVALAGISLTPAANAETVTLRVTTWLADQTEKAIYDRWAAEYTRSHPGVRVEIEMQAGSYDDKIITQTLAGTAPDLIRVVASTLPAWADAKIVMPIPDGWLSEISLADMLPVTRAAGTYKGGFYGWDPHISAYALHYDENAFAKAGLQSPGSATTWNDLAEAAKKLTQRSPNGSIERFGLNLNYWELERLWMIHVWTQGGNAFDANGEPLFPNDQTVAALRYLQSLVTELQVSPPQANDSRQAFAGGKAALTFDGIWMNRLFSSSGNITHATAVMPHAQSRATLAIPVLWAISATSKHPREAWELQKFWVGKKNALEFADYGGAGGYGIPVWQSAFADPKWKAAPTVTPLVQMAAYARSMPPFKGANRWIGEASQQFRNVVLGQQPPESALGEMARRARIIRTEAEAGK